MPRVIELYPFRLRDPLTGKWIRARYVLEAPAIRCRYSDFELVGPPERRTVPDDPLSLTAAGVARGYLT